jgi:hypothetical protein
MLCFKNGGGVDPAQKESDKQANIILNQSQIEMASTGNPIF